MNTFKMAADYCQFIQRPHLQAIEVSVATDGTVIRSRCAKMHFASDPYGELDYGKKLSISEVVTAADRITENKHIQQQHFEDILFPLNPSPPISTQAPSKDDSRLTPLRPRSVHLTHYVFGSFKEILFDVPGPHNPYLRRNALAQLPPQQQGSLSSWSSQDPSHYQAATGPCEEPVYAGQRFEALKRHLETELTLCLGNCIYYDRGDFR